ncbi:MAG: SPOR domain-containing protein [Oceanospirillaceae bacterium]|nr:SPOR domain-containing protein [Oceanospirillaceae bacterium]
MEVVVKKQIIGALAIVFVLLVFFPLFFSGNGYKERHLSSVIPPKVVHSYQNIEPLLKPLVEAEQLTAKKTPQPSVKTHTGELDQQGIPVAWTLQLASFKDEANARALRKQLLKAGHKVYSRKNGALVKVYVGPDIKKQRLEVLKAGLKRDFGLDGLLVRFTTQ